MMHHHHALARKRIAFPTRFLVVALFAGAAGSLAGCLPTRTLGAVHRPGPQPLTEVTIQMRDMHYTPDTIRVPAAQPLMLTFVNDDTTNHDFVIRGGDAGIIHLFVPSGRRIATSLFFDKPGVLQFVCSQSGHEAAGMVGKIVVETQ